TIVNGFRIIQLLFAGVSIAPALYLCTVNTLSSAIDVELTIHGDNYQLLVGYTVKFSKLGKIEETLTYTDVLTNKKSKVYYSEETVQKEQVFNPLNRNVDFGVNRNTIVSYLVNIQKSRNEFQSFFFNDESKSLLNDNLKDENFKEIINIIPEYAKTKILIIDHARSVMSAVGLEHPISLLINDNEGNRVYTENIFSGYKNQSNSNTLQSLKNGITSVNQVVSQLIPNFQLQIKNEKRIPNPLEEIYEFDFWASRDGMEFPYSFESDGVKSLVSYIACLIHMYNQEDVIVIIDEFDSSIFEYLLGELLQVVKQGSKGQFVFTSHNLRALEVLDTKDVWFTTTNPDNRYIQFTNIKNNHNLRDVYYRTIQLGGQKEEVYKACDQAEIRRAFSKV